MNNFFDAALEQIFEKDVELLKKTKLPIVTVSASYIEDLKGFYGHKQNENLPDVVFSRAHYSMTVGIAVTAWGKKIDPAKAWLVDPTNYVSQKEWQKIQLTELIGKTIARNPILKSVKDIIDRFGRKQLPILKSITPPLLHLFKEVERPILSMHIAAGNALANKGKTVVQVVTDPHVRDEYLDNIDRPNFTLCVFDDKTKTDALEKAAILGKVADPAKIIVTGPPIDPRIIACRATKKPWHRGKLNLCLSTGGLGTNKDEIKQVLEQVLPELRKKDSPYKLMVYAGTQTDIFSMTKSLAKKHQVKLITLTSTDQPKSLLDQQASSSKSAQLYVVYHPQIVDANELLIKFAFPWADGFITKPSGDMAYDAAASGSFLLTLSEWGVWEEHIRELFEQRGVARTAEVDHIATQLEALAQSSPNNPSWITKAMEQAQKLPPLFLEGNKHIIETVERLP